MSDVKPCAHCGGRAELYGSWQDSWIVECTKCHASTDDYKENFDAIFAWNKRADDAQIAANDNLPAENDISADGHARNDTETVDSRERLEADVRGAVHGAYAYEDYIPEDMIFDWLDRQAVITEREVCEYFHMLDRTDELEEQVDSLTAELEEAQKKLKDCSREVFRRIAENNNLRSRNSFLNDTMTEQIAKLLDENDCIEVSERGIDGKRRLVTGTQRKLEKQVEELTAERDELRDKLTEKQHVCDVQRDSFLKLERELKEAKNETD